MIRRFTLIALVAGLYLSSPGAAVQAASRIGDALAKQVLDPLQPKIEVELHLAKKTLPFPSLTTRQDWERFAVQLRGRVIREVVLRGEAKSWAAAKTKVVWMKEEIKGDGYRVRKLRYEALPDLWIPALLYVPDKLAGRAPAILNVNGHDAQGKAAGYKQIRCINQAKRGILALNVEWPGMGQLRGPGFVHYRMNQIDLCGTSGLAVHYLYMKRGLDLLRSLPETDPERVGVTGLSGGGWQTIFISALDPRVKLSNPVAGYSSYLTRVLFDSDLGDSEQTPCDFGAMVDYSHLTAMLAPRATLLTFNAKDQCCFRADHALGPLLNVAAPVFSLLGAPERLRHHVNYEPGNHNYERDNREQFYSLVKDFFFPGNRELPDHDLPVENEVRSAEELQVELPPGNLDFHSIAVSLAQSLPRDSRLPQPGEPVAQWRGLMRERVREVVRAPDLRCRARLVAEEQGENFKASYWTVRLGTDWTVPVVELAPASARTAVLLLGDEGRTKLESQAAELLSQGCRVLAVDPFYLGESKIPGRDFLLALLMSCLGERPLGLQASQLRAIARWASQERRLGPVQVVAVGPRTSLMSLVAAALEEKDISGVKMYRPFKNLHEILQRDLTVDQAPELFCFGLLEAVSANQLKALVAPRPVAEIAE